VFERNSVQVRKERPARKEPLTEKDVKGLLASVSEVVIAKGKKATTHPVKEVKPDMLKGPSGNYRAPMLIRGKKMLVGYSADTLEDWFG
jgi:arsenate reductase-like glutaredoxin family protein